MIYAGVVLVDTTGVYFRSKPWRHSPFYVVSINQQKSFLFKRWWSQNDSEKPSLPINPPPQMITFFAWVWTFACLHGKEGNIFLSQEQLLIGQQIKDMETSFYLSCIATCTSFQPRPWMLKRLPAISDPLRAFLLFFNCEFLYKVIYTLINSLKL